MWRNGNLQISLYIYTSPFASLALAHLFRASLPYEFLIHCSPIRLLFSVSRDLPKPRRIAHQAVQSQRTHLSPSDPSDNSQSSPHQNNNTTSFPGSCRPVSVVSNPRVTVERLTGIMSFALKVHFDQMYIKAGARDVIVYLAVLRSFLDHLLPPPPPSPL